MNRMVASYPGDGPACAQSTTPGIFLQALEIASEIPRDLAAVG